ncbi:MAG TPA: sugar phosphate isomerase/epimerase [Candidatus Hydrogenedentes bacterium]|nr:sugar phosphate isomerase/epimerase [Candidatus Hydrogenedentota bacterium]
MKLAIDSGLFACQSWEESFDQIAEAGYTFVEWSQRIGFFFQEVSEKELLRVGKLLERAGLKLAGMIPMCPLASPIQEEREKAVEDWKRLIAVTASLGARQIFGEMTGNPHFKEDRALCSNAFRRSLAALAPVLADARMRASFEPHPGDFIEGNHAAVDFLRDLGHAEIGYLFCMPHAFVMGEQSAADMVRYAGNTITHVHIADTHPASRIIAPPEVRAHEHMLPGWGELDFPSILEALHAVAYDGFVSAVLFSHADSDPAVPLQVAQAMKQYAVETLGLTAQ